MTASAAVALARRSGRVALTRPARQRRVRIIRHFQASHEGGRSFRWVLALLCGRAARRRRATAPGSALWDYRFGFQLVRWSVYAGLATAALALVFLLIPRLRDGRVRRSGRGARDRRSASPTSRGTGCRTRAPSAAINDITTDTENPPAFVALAPVARRRSPCPPPIPEAKPRTAAAARLSRHPSARAAGAAGGGLRARARRRQGHGLGDRGRRRRRGPHRSDGDHALVRLPRRRRRYASRRRRRAAGSTSAPCRGSARATSGPTRSGFAPISRSSAMRDNPVKATLAAGGCAFGAMVFEFFSPGMPQICRNAGAEFVLYDMEHTGLGFETLKTQFALCRGLPLVPMVRVPRGEYHFIARALDVGAMGVMVPMVGTPEEAAHIVACTRYPPQGRRGAAFGFAHDDYEGGDVAAKIAALHARTMVIPQIETARGPRQRRGHRRRARRRRAVGRALRPHEFHGHPGPVPASRLPGRDRSHRRRVRGARQDGRVPRDRRRLGARLRRQGLPADGLRHRPADAAARAAPRPRRAARVEPADERAPDDRRPCRSASRATSSIRAASRRSAPRRSRSSTARPASSGSTCRRSSARSPPTTPRATTRCTSICRASPPPPWRAPIAGCASSRGTASATTRSTSRR